MQFDLINGFLQGILPEKRLLVSEWADNFRILSQTASAEYGKWRTDRTPYLRKIMDVLSSHSTYQRVVFMKAAQIGAALDINTPIPTPEGWKRMEDIKVGDSVYDETGRKVKVNYVSEIMENHNCYDVHFSDNSIIKADADHIWSVCDEKNYRYRRNVNLRTIEMLTTFKHRKVRNRYAIDVCKPIECNEKELIMPPYTLGVWLGDGNSWSNRVTTHKDDIEEMKAYIELEGVNCEITNKHSKGNCREIVFNRPKGICLRGHDLSIYGVTKHNSCAECARRWANGDGVPSLVYTKFHDRLNSLELINNKHIPDIYLRSSIAQRLELLRGLMDTDGHVTKKGYCEFCGIDKKLIDGVCELIASLGYKPVLRVKKGGKLKIINEGNEYISKDIYVITFHAQSQLNVFKLKRKSQRIKSIEDCRITEINRRRITNIVQCESVPVKCIQVENESHLYLAGKTMIPTHNTEMGSNWIGYIIDNAPAPTLIVWPTDDMVKKNSKIRITPMIMDCPTLKEKVAPTKSRSADNTIEQKNFPGGVLYITGGNSAVGLRSMPIKNLLLDEIDGYPTDLDGEGSPIELAIARTRTFKNKKIFIISTPTIAGESAIESEFLNTDQNYYNVPCPHCGSYQRLIFEQLKWNEGKPESAQYQCSHCDKYIEERYKPEMLANGKWEPSVIEKVNDQLIGFHLNSLYSPYGWMSWGEIADTFEKSRRDPKKEKVFVNTVLGETYAESGEAPAFENLYNRREDYKLNTVNNNVCFLTAGVDIQKDRIEFEIVGWCPDKQSYSIDYRVILGNTTLKETWNELDKVVYETWTREDGTEMGIKLMAIDSGYNTSEVYAFCRKYPITHVIPIKGSDSLGIAIAPPKQVDVNQRGKKIGKQKIWSVGVSYLKSELYGWLKLEKDKDEFPAYYCHFPQYDQKYFQGLTAEDWIAAKKKWHKRYERNEPLDVRIYARAASVIVGLDRLKPDQLKAIYGIPVEKKSETTRIKKKSDSFWG